MKRKPIIGIVGKVNPNFIKDLWEKNAVDDENRYYIVKNGGIAISLLPSQATLKFNDNDIKDDTVLTQEELGDLYKQIDLCDGFLLQGGMYSCNYEIEIVKRVLELNKPLLGICAGFNNILRALGTDVLLDEHKTHDFFDKDYRHKIIIDKDSIIYDLLGKEEYEVNSIHSMIATKEIVNSVARSTSYSEEGLVESFQMDDKKFVVGIKWHPEIMHDEFVDKLFKMLVDKSSE